MKTISTKVLQGTLESTFSWSLLMDSPLACNHSSSGCRATENKKSDELSLETHNCIITKGKVKGTYASLFSGG